jgi:hypothetical protein
MLTFNDWLLQQETFAVSPSIVDEEEPIVDADKNKGAFPFYSDKEMPIKKNCGCGTKKLAKKK